MVTHHMIDFMKFETDIPAFRRWLSTVDPKAHIYGFAPKSTLAVTLASNGHHTLLKVLFEEHPTIDVNETNSINFTPLAIASMRGYVECVRVLLLHPDINVNQVERDWTALHWAVEKRQLGTIKALIEDSRVDASVCCGGLMQAPLDLSLEYPCNISVIELLLSRKEIDVNGKSFCPPLVASVLGGQEEATKLLLGNDSIDLTKKYHGKNALETAKKTGTRGQVQMLEALMKKKRKRTKTSKKKIVKRRKK